MRLFLSILLLIFSVKVVAQKQHTIDSLLTELKKTKTDTSKVRLLNKLSRAYIKIDSTKGINYAKSALNLAKKTSWKEGTAESYYWIGAQYREYFVTSKAHYYYNLAIKNTNNQRLLSNINLEIGQCYLHQSNYKEALRFFHKSLKLNEITSNKKGIIKVSTLIGSVYSGIRNDDKALSYYMSALKMSKEINENKYLGGLYRGIGVVYSDKEDYKKALENFQKAYDISVKEKNLETQADLLSDIALIYLFTEEYNKAIQSSTTSLKIQKKINNNELDIGFNYGVIGDSYIEIAKEKNNNVVYLDSAIANLNQAIKLHTKIKSMRSLYDDYTSLSLAQKLKQNYKSSLEAYETSIVYKDSMYNTENKETIQNLEDKREIELRDKEIKINNLKLEAKEKQKWYFIFGLGLLGIIGGLLLYQNQNRKKTNEKLLLLNTNLDQKNHDLDKANKTNARFFGILNHDLRSPVYNLIHFLHLQKENPELLDEATKNSIQTKTMTSAENLLQSMEDLLLWSKSQMENFQPQPQEFQIETLFDDTKKHFSSIENIQFQFENLNNLSLVTDENYLKTIVRNLTGNAIKALVDVQNPRIIWKAFQKNGNTILSITDNGKGASDEQFKALYDDTEVIGIKSGLGLHLIRDLAKAIDCEITVDSKINEGTTITLKL